MNQMTLCTSLGRCISLLLSNWQIWPRKSYRQVTPMLTLRYSGGNWYPHVTAYIPFTSCAIIFIFLENIALEIITLDVYTANVTISNVTFDPHVYVHVPLTLYKFIFYLILANMALEIIRGGESNADATISREKLIPTCHCIHPIHI